MFPENSTLILLHLLVGLVNELWIIIKQYNKTIISCVAIKFKGV